MKSPLPGDCVYATIYVNGARAEFAIAFTDENMPTSTLLMRVPVDSKDGRTFLEGLEMLKRHIRDSIATGKTIETLYSKDSVDEPE